MRVNIKQVAEAAKVSTATVSHVINETRYVSDATRERVLKAVSYTHLDVYKRQMFLH